MMQEVSIMVAYDAHVVDRPGEEDTLACLVAHSRPLRTPRPVVGLSSPHSVLFLSSRFTPFFTIALLFLLTVISCRSVFWLSVES